MKIVWKISSSDKKYVKDFLNAHHDNPYVLRRIRQNVTRTRVNLSRKRIWKVLVGCLLTTQQKSGPKSWVAKFIKTKPFPLDYNTCLSKYDVVENFSYKTLSSFGGIRRTKSIASEIARNLALLENGLWTEILKMLKSLQYEATQEEERKIADYIDDHFVGFGPKQSRNFLQWLGLTRYETPIDSRILKWLKDFGFPVALNPKALSDKNYYHFVSDGFQELSKACDVYPCILDASVFVSFNVNNRTRLKAR